MRVERLEVVKAHRLDCYLHYFFVRDSERALLLLKVELSGLHQHTLRYQSDDLGSGDPESSGGGGSGDFLVGHVQRCRLDVGDVHRDLSDAIFINVPTNCLAPLEGSRLPAVLAVLVLEDLSGQASALPHLAALLAHVEGDRHRAPCGCRVEIIVDGHEEVSGSHVDGPALRHGLVVLLRSEVRCLGRIGDLLGEGLIFPGPADREVLPFRLERRRLVAVARDAELVVDSLRQPARKFGAFLKSGLGHRHERQHVARP